MGFGDNEPPAIRADAFPATLRGPGGFRILVLTFVSWDVIKFSARAEGEVAKYLVIDSGQKATDFEFRPAKSGALYTLTAQGCAKAIDGSTNYCSPPASISKLAATNTGSLQQFLRLSGIDLRSHVFLRALLGTPGGSLRTSMGL